MILPWELRIPNHEDSLTEYCIIDVTMKSYTRIRDHESEYETILSGENEREQTERFYRYWVLKESFMKATREGMALPLDSFCIKLGNKPGDPPVLIRQPEKYPLSYYYREYFVEGIPCRMAVCSTDREIDSEIHMELSL